MSPPELGVQGLTLLSLLRSRFRDLNLVVTGDFKSSPGGDSIDDDDEDEAEFSVGISITNDDEGTAVVDACEEPPSSSSKQALPELTCVWFPQNNTFVGKFGNSMEFSGEEIDSSGSAGAAAGEFSGATELRQSGQVE